MKKVLFFLLLPVIIYSQAGIPDNVFHKIGFQDYYYLWIASGKQFDQMPNNDFYYPLMDSLGLTHIVTYADPRALNNDQGIKLMDSRIERWGHDSGLNDFWPMVYGYSSGNYSNSLPYEIGGPVASQTLKADYWGFGNPAETSYWFRDSRTDHSAGDIDNNGGAITVIRFEKDIDQPDVMIKSNIIPNHQTNTYILPQYDQKYKVGIRAKIATISGGNDNDIVATITVTEVGWQNIVIPPDKLSKIDTLSFSKTRALLYSSNITAGQLTDTYTDLTFAPFYKTDANMALEILIDWKNTRTMSVDKIWVFDNYYEKLFYTDPTVSETNISNKISLKLNLNNEFNNSNYYHLYMDEPAPLQNRSYDKVSSISSNLPNGKYMNAANWAFPESELAVENYFRRPNYVSIDYYPFGNIGYGTTEVQTSLDNLIAYSNYTGSTGGLRAAIKWAHNFDDDPSNDKRFFHTMQVHAETQDKSGSLEVVHRAPTAAEIYVQGYLAMCYGATGLIYYALHTTTDANNKLWGLFDEVGNHFIGNYNQVQNKINAVEPNDRFYAVKELNRQVDQVSSELLKLT